MTQKNNNICRECAYHSYDVFARSLCNHPDKGITEVWDYCPACLKFKAKFNGDNGLNGLYDRRTTTQG